MNIDSFHSEISLPKLFSNTQRLDCESLLAGEHSPFSSLQFLPHLRQPQRGQNKAPKAGNMPLSHFNFLPTVTLSTFCSILS